MALASDTTPLQKTIQATAFFNRIDTRTAEQKAADDLRWGQERREREIEYQNQQRAEMWKRLGSRIGPDYAAADLAAWVFHGAADDRQSQRNVIAKLNTYLDELRANVEGGKNLLVMGPMGSGKDVLMAAAMKFATLQWGLDVMWRNGMSLYAEIRSSMSPASEQSESCLLRMMIDAQVLAISDPLPPSGALTEFQAATLFAILDARYRHRRPTWITINVLNRNEAQARMGAQNVDRLAHRATTLFTNWGSFREFERQGASK